MDSSIVDNKLNMSLGELFPDCVRPFLPDLYNCELNLRFSQNLVSFFYLVDDIIKKERKAKQRQQNGAVQSAARKRIVSKQSIRGKRSIAVRSVTHKNRQQTAVNGGLSAAAAMKVVNRLVKKAIQRRANQSLINRAATLRRRALRRNSAVRPAIRGLRARRQAAVVGSRLVGRLSGINQRSRIIRRNAGKSARRQPVIFTSPQVVRGRGLSHIGQLASDSEAFMVEQREIGGIFGRGRAITGKQGGGRVSAHPVLQQKVLRREVLAGQPRREVIMQRRARPVVVEQRPIIIRRGGIRKRAVMNEPNVVVVRNAVHFSIPRRQVQFRTQSGFGNVQRVVDIRPRNRLVRKMQYVVNPNAVQMRKALGIGVRRSEPQRFESSSTFLQRVPVSNRRGRGFQDVLYN
uniref:Uncharacterized protein n=1 Tax=Setaria digitata TaxID=48799 RepID=A0A915Q7F2_9BILA